MKTGTKSHDGDSLIHLLVGIFTNPKLFVGYCLYGCAAVLMVVALKYGELSILYPVIAMTYVWVTGLSVLFLNETLNPWKLAGLTSIVLGVGVLGRTRRVPAKVAGSA